jgi:hypothetical protein
MLSMLEVEQRARAQLIEMAEQVLPYISTHSFPPSSPLPSPSPSPSPSFCPSPSLPLSVPLNIYLSHTNSLAAVTLLRVFGPDPTIPLPSCRILHFDPSLQATRAGLMPSKLLGGRILPC